MGGEVNVILSVKTAARLSPNNLRVSKEVKTSERSY